MPEKISINYAAHCTKQIGTGPLLTVLYEGVFGVSSSFLGSMFRKKFKEKPKRVLIKKIDSRIVSERIEWDVLRGLDHPNVARYIHICERSNLFSCTTVIVQDFCEHTLEHFAPLLRYNRIGNITVFKNAVKEIAAGLNYLHSNSIVHRNLKPSNILVKPPLSNPSRFILTDFWYTDLRHVPDNGLLCLQPQKPVCDDQDIMQWMSPELLADWGTTPTSMMDMFSFGAILKFMISHGPLSLDHVDGILLELLIQESLSFDPWRRITSRDLLENHPFLLDTGLRGVTEIAYSRISYVKTAYDEILRLEADSSYSNLRQRIESKVRCIAGEDIFPWNKLFNKRIMKELNGHTQNSYNPQSFVDLLKLVSDFKKFLPMGIKSDILRREIADDAFSKYFPYTIPLTYLCISCKDMTFLPSLVILENETKRRKKKYRRI